MSRPCATARQSPDGLLAINHLLGMHRQGYRCAGMSATAYGLGQARTALAAFR